MIKSKGIFLLCVIYLVNLIKSLKPNELTFNPYRYYDNRENDWRIIEILKDKKDLFYRTQLLTYKTFKKEQKIIRIDSSLNQPTRFNSKLSAKLFYFMTNHYKPKKHRDRDFKMESPFIINREDKDILTNMQLVQYETKEISLNLTIKDKIDHAEIVDIFSDTPEIVPLMCSDYTQIQQQTNNCLSNKFKTDDPMDAIPLSFRFIPKKEGKHKYNLYVLTIINKTINIIVTVVGNYNVKKHPEYNLYYSKNIFRIGLDKSNYDYLWVKNNKKKTVNILSLQGYGRHLKLNYPKKFKQTEFSALNIDSKLRQRIKNSNLNYWLIPSNDERPIIEIEFNQKSKVYQMDKSSPIEVLRSKLQSNILRIIVDKRPLLLSFSVFFAPDYKFWNQDFINCGVLTDKDMWHEVAVYASSKTPLPVFLHNVEINFENKDFRVLAATNYKYGIPFPFENQRMTLFNLLVKYEGKENFAKLSGKIKSTIDIYNTSYEETLNFYAIYYRDIFFITTKDKNNLVTSTKKTFSIYLTQQTNSIIRIEQISIRGDKVFDQDVDVLPNKNEILKPGIEYKLYDIDFSMIPKILSKTTAVFIVKIKAMENIFSFKIEFPIESMLCSIEQKNPKEFKDCRVPSKLSYPLFNKKRLFIERSFYLKNPNQGKLVLHRIKARSFNLDFENHIHLKHIPKTENIDYYSEINYSYQINRPLTIMFPSLNVEKGDIVQLMISIKIPNDYIFKDKKYTYKSLIVLYTKKGEEYMVNLEYEFIVGELKFFPKKMNRQILFPTGINDVTIGSISTFEKPITIEIPKKEGPTNQIFELRTFNRIIKKGNNDSVMEFKIDPNLLKNFENHIISQDIQTKEGICLTEMENYYNNKSILKNLKEISNLKINTKIILKNSIQEDFVIDIEGEIILASFFQNVSPEYKLDLGYVSDRYSSDHDLHIYNPFKTTVEFEVIIAPKSFINMDLIDNEIINKIKSDEKKKRGTICMKNDHMPLETLKYYAHRIYSKHLDYVKELKPRNHQKAQKFACFITPKNETETEMIMFKIQTFNNYFFEFIQDRDKNNFLKKQVVVISDFEEYSNFKKKEEIKIENNWDLLFDYKDQFVNKVAEYFPEFFENKKKTIKNKKKRKKKKNDFISIKHIKDLKKIKKQKEIFLSDEILEKKFILKPFESIVLKKGLKIIPLKKTLNDETNEMVLLIKNNITKLEIKEIKYKKFKKSLKIYNAKGRPITEKNLIFEIFKKESPNLFEKKTGEFSFNKVISKYFTFYNKGRQDIFIKKIEILNKGKIEKCLELVNFEPRLLKIKEYFEFRIIFLPCRKMLKNFNLILKVYEDKDTWVYNIKVIFNHFHIRNIEKEEHYDYIVTSFIIILITHFLLLSSSILKFCQKNVKYKITKKIRYPKLITENSLEEKLKIHKAEITLKTIKLLQKMKMNENIRLRKNSESDNIKEFNTVNRSTGILNKILPGKEEYLKNYDYNKNVFSKIPNNLPLDSSNISIEKIYKLLENPKSYSDDENREGIINDTVDFENFEEITKSKNNFGSIGDNSFSGLQSTINQDISFVPKTYKKNKEEKNDNQNPNEFINSFVISQKLRDDSGIFENDENEEYYADDESQENSQENSSFLDLNNAFGYYPLGMKKKKQVSKISASSKEYVKPSGLVRRIIQRGKDRKNKSEFMK